MITTYLIEYFDGSFWYSTGHAFAARDLAEKLMAIFKARHGGTFRINEVRHE